MAKLAPKFSTITIQTDQTGDFQICITSSKISFETQFKAQIVLVANRAARHLRLKMLEKEQKKGKSRSGYLGIVHLVVVYSIYGSTIYYLLVV